MLVEAPRPSDDLETFKRRVCLAISRLSTSKLGQSASPRFAALTVGGGAISSTLIGQWNTAYSWGDHAGLYDPVGTAAGEIGTHESTYDHSLLHSPVTLGTANGLSLDGQEVSLPITATPTFGTVSLVSTSYPACVIDASGDDATYPVMMFKADRASASSCGSFTAYNNGGTPCVNLVFKRGTTDTQGSFELYTSNALRLTVAEDGVVSIGGNVTCGQTIRANSVFNLNGTDGVSDSSSGVPTALTVSGGIITAVTKSDWLNQSVKTTASPAFAGLSLSGLLGQSRTVTSTAQYGVQSVMILDTSAGDLGYGIGGQFRIYATGSNNVTNNIQGVYGIAQQSGTGNILTANGTTGLIQCTAAGSISNASALYAGGPYITAGSITAAYGVYIAAQKVTGVTNGYGVYQIGASDNNIFAGKTRFGSGGGLPAEAVHSLAKIRADTCFNLNGTDGMSDSDAGVPTALTVSGGIVTAVTKNDWLDQNVKTTALPQFARLGLGTAASSQYRLYVGESTTATSGSRYPIEIQCELNPTAASAVNVRVIDAVMKTYGEYDLTGSLTALVFPLRNYSTGTMTTQRGIWLAPQNLGTSGVYGDITTQESVYIAGTNSGGTISAYYGIRHGYSNSGTVSSGFFLYDTSGFLNYLSGKLGVGTSSPSEQIHVTDTVRADTAFNLNGTDGATGSFTSNDGKTITVTGGIITAIV